MEVGKSESSQTDKNDNINIIADDNESNSKGNPSIISDYNIFNGASNNYNNIFNHSFDSDTSNNSFHSVKTPHPYMKSKSSSNNFIYNDSMELMNEPNTNNDNNFNYSSFSPMRQQVPVAFRYSGNNLSHFANGIKPTFSSFMRCNSNNINNTKNIFTSITSNFVSNNNNSMINSPITSHNSINANIEFLNSPSNFKLNYIGNSNKEFFTPQYHKKNKKKSLDIPRNKIHLESVLRQKDKRTTIMIRHIPNKYTLKLFSDEINKCFYNKYDVLYLPVDTDNHCNLGFGFINFVEPVHIIDFYDRYCGKKWEKFNSDKICELAYAKVQGKEELIKHITQSGVTNSFDMPVYVTYEIKEEKRAIELPMKYLQAFLSFYPYSLYRIVSNDRFAIDSFYNF